MHTLSVPPAIVVGSAKLCPNQDDAMELNDELRAEYEKRFGTLRLNNHRAIVAVATVIARIMRSEARYKSVAEETGVPWHLIAVIHSLECGSDFTCHLHNGDPLDRRTVNVPKNRPVTGKPPFTWEESAKDALIYEGLTEWKDWTVSGTLYQLEKYNGFGYRAKNVPTPYLYGGTQFYQSGKFIKDHVFDRMAVSDQIGAAAVLKRMEDLGLASFEQKSDSASICEAGK